MLQPHDAAPKPGAEMLRPAQVATILGVSPNTLAIWRYYRRGPSYLKVGRQVRYPLEWIEEFMATAIRDCDPEVIKQRGRR